MFTTRKFFSWQNSSNHGNCNIKFSLNTFSDQITICQISFEIFEVKQIATQAKKYLNSIRVFPLLHLIFLLKWNKQIFSRIHKKDQKQLPKPAILLKKETQLFSCEFCKISKNTFSNRAPLVAASEKWKIGKPITLQINFFTQVTGNRVSDH